MFYYYGTADDDSEDGGDYADCYGQSADDRCSDLSGSRIRDFDDVCTVSVQEDD